MDNRAQVALDTLCSHVDAVEVETRRHFDIVMEGLRADIRLLAKRWDARIDQLETTLLDEIARSHDALVGLIRLTYADLDRRVTALEQRPRASD